MDKIFKFSLLKYRPSYVLGEQVNVAILFLFLEDNKVFFYFPNNLERLSALYPDVDIKDITLSLHELGEKASKLIPKYTLKTTNLDTLIEKEFLIADANCFFFSDFKTGIYESPDKIVVHFLRKYFAVYEQCRQNKHRPHYISSSEVQFLRNIIRKDHEYTDKTYFNSPAPSASALSSHSE